MSQNLQILSNFKNFSLTIWQILKMLQNAYFLAKIGADTAENEQHFAEILPTDAL